MTNEELEKIANKVMDDARAGPIGTQMPSRTTKLIFEALSTVRDSVVTLPNEKEVTRWLDSIDCVCDQDLPCWYEQSDKQKLTEFYNWLRSQIKTVQPILDVPLWIKHDSSIEVYDGSSFAGAVKVKNNKTNKETWEIYTFIVIADGENFSLLNCIEGEGGDEFGAWSWDDFEYIIPINEDAERTLFEARILGETK